MKPLPMFMIALVLGILAFGLWYQSRHPRQIVSEGTISVTARKAGATAMTLKTRVVSIDGQQFSEVEMPNGTWIGCEGDCVRAAREARDELWDKFDRVRP